MTNFNKHFHQVNFWRVNTTYKYSLKWYLFIISVMTLSTTCCKSKSNCIAKNVIEYVFVCVQRYFFNLIYVRTYLCSYEWTLKIHPRAFRSNGFKCRKFKTCEKNILSTYYIVKMYLSLINLFLYNLRWLSNLLK